MSEDARVNVRVNAQTLSSLRRQKDVKLLKVGSCIFMGDSGKAKSLNALALCLFLAMNAQTHMRSLISHLQQTF